MNKEEIKTLYKEWQKLRASDMRYSKPFEVFIDDLESPPQKSELPTDEEIRKHYLGNGWSANMRESAKIDGAKWMRAVAQTLLEQKDRELAEQKELIDKAYSIILWVERFTYNHNPKGRFNNLQKDASKFLTEYNKEK